MRSSWPASANTVAKRPEKRSPCPSSTSPKPAVHLAHLVGDKYAIVTSMSRTIPLIEDSLRSSGLLSRCAGIDAVGLPVLDLESDAEATVEAFTAPARRAIDAGADVIVLGCAGLSYLQQRLSEDLHVPVIDGVAAAVTLAEGLVHLGLKTSQAHGYAPPLPKHRPGWPVSRALGYRALA